jgi:hypothetical protein
MIIVIGITALVGILTLFPFENTISSDLRWANTFRKTIGNNRQRWRGHPVISITEAVALKQIQIPFTEPHCHLSLPAQQLSMEMQEGRWKFQY